MIELKPTMEQANEKCKQTKEPAKHNLKGQRTTKKYSDFEEVSAVPKKLFF